MPIGDVAAPEDFDDAARRGKRGVRAIRNVC
jgi:hypothetical protein